MFFSYLYFAITKNCIFSISPFYQPQKSVQPERSRKHNFKSKICFSLLDHVSFFSSTPQNSEQAPHFQSKTPHSLLPTPQSKRKATPSQSGCDSVLVSINFCVATQIKPKTNRFRLYFLHFRGKIACFSTTSAPPEIPKIF